MRRVWIGTVIVAASAAILAVAGNGAAGASPLWSEDHEDAEGAGWSYVAVSGDASAEITTLHSHSGTYGLELTIRGADGEGESPGVRMEKHQDVPGYEGDENLPVDAYYSAFYYFPSYVEHNGWFWNVFQWKRGHATSSEDQTRHPTWVVNVVNAEQGGLRFLLENKVGEDNTYQPFGTPRAEAPVDLPIGRWVHLECRYVWSMSPQGRITCWQDGVLIWDVVNVRTDLDYPYNEDKWQWSVNNYAGDTEPTNHSVFVDDAAISLERLGPDWKSGTFTDDDTSVHEESIEYIAALGITRGCNPPVNDNFCPGDNITRGQMAAFLVRALGLPDTSTDFFDDDDGTTFENDINRLAQAGTASGCGNGNYCASNRVTRGQMAAFLVRGFGYTGRTGTDFIDDDDSIFEGDIEKLATAGVTRGCNPPANDRYCPEDFVTRGEMASFLERAIKARG